MLASEKRVSAPLPLEPVSLLVGLNVLGMTLSLWLVLPERSFDFAFLGSRATIILSGTWLFALLLGVLTASGVETIMRAHPRVHLSETRYTAILWILPCLLVMGVVLILPSFRPAPGYALLTIVVTGILLLLVVLGEYLTIDLRDPMYSFARLGLNLAVYLAALVLFQFIYALKLRSILSAPLIGIAAALLALELLRASESDVRRTWLYAATVGLALSQALWALNYWNVSALVGGVTLLVLFYLLTGFIQQYLFGQLRWRTLLEFAFVVVAVVLLLWRRGMG